MRLNLLFFFFFLGVCAAKLSFKIKDSLLALSHFILCSTFASLFFRSLLNLSSLFCPLYFKLLLHHSSLSFSASPHFLLIYMLVTNNRVSKNEVCLTKSTDDLIIRNF